MGALQVGMQVGRVALMISWSPICFECFQATHVIFSPFPSHVLLIPGPFVFEEVSLLTCMVWTYGYGIHGPRVPEVGQMFS